MCAVVTCLPVSLPVLFKEAEVGSDRIMQFLILLLITPCFICQSLSVPKCCKGFFDSVSQTCSTTGYPIIKCNYLNWWCYNVRFLVQYKVIHLIWDKIKLLMIMKQFIIFMIDFLKLKMALFRRDFKYVLVLRSITLVFGYVPIYIWGHVYTNVGISA